jgi:hypothetical protein
MRARSLSRRNTPCLSPAWEDANTLTCITDVCASNCGVDQTITVLTTLTGEATSGVGLFTYNTRALLPSFFFFFLSLFF